MRDYQKELNARVEFIKEQLKSSSTSGIVFGNSGGKDCALVGILCKKACENVTGVLMPCGSSQNYGSDTDDAQALSRQFDIESITVDLTEVKNSFMSELALKSKVSEKSATNINPRLRMATLYAIAQSKNYLVAGTGNKSERFMGYFTKWGDGGCDFNPISDLTVTEVYEFLRFLKAPASIIDKAPSAGLFEGQTDEGDMGVKYSEIDAYIRGEDISKEAKEIIERAHKLTEHKRTLPKTFNE